MFPGSQTHSHINFRNVKIKRTNQAPPPQSTIWKFSEDSCDTKAFLFVIFIYLLFKLWQCFWKTLLRGTGIQVCCFLEQSQCVLIWHGREWKSIVESMNNMILISRPTQILPTGYSTDFRVCNVSCFVVLPCQHAITLSRRNTQSSIPTRL